jgi:ribonuclease BN (tRNA processing enzyme)
MVAHTPAMMKKQVTVPTLREVQLWTAETLKAIWISHPHADHHLGVVGSFSSLDRHCRSLCPASLQIRVISERRRLLTSAQSFEPLLLIAPETVLSFVKAFEEFDPLLAGSYLPVNNRSTLTAPPPSP